MATNQGGLPRPSLPPTSPHSQQLLNLFQQHATTPPPIPEGKDEEKSVTGSDVDSVVSDGLSELLKKYPHLQDLGHSATESIGHRRVVHRRVQSSALFSILDTPVNLRHRMRSMSMAEPPSLEKFYPGSHLLDGETEDECVYLSLWLLPPASMLKRLSKEVVKLSLEYTSLGSSAAFLPHITIVGSIRCQTHREVEDLGLLLKKGLENTGGVPCRFYHSQSKDIANTQPPQKCEAMYTQDEVHCSKLVWSQSCIAFMERSEEYMSLLEKSRAILELPQGEWMFPAPAREPHLSKFYGREAIPDDKQPPSPEPFIADQVSLFYTTPGTVEGVKKWREVIRISLVNNNEGK